MRCNLEPITQHHDPGFPVGPGAAVACATLQKQRARRAPDGEQPVKGQAGREGVTTGSAPGSAQPER